METKTPLYERHVSLGGKPVPFAGYLLPVQYSDVIPEHMAVRERAGLFDVSHMGELILTGSDALANLNRIFTNDFTSMADGRVRYSPLCNENGGIVDDMIVYRFSQERYMVVPNASNRRKVMDFVSAHIMGDAALVDASDAFAQIALQGPRAEVILSKLTDAANIPSKYYTFKDNVQVAGVACLLSRTGYTGEAGFELYCNPTDAIALWDALLAAGAPEGLIPCGLGARDTLRLEAAMPLYGHEMTDDINPFEAGLSFAVKMAKPDFIGKSALLAAGAPQRVRVGLRVTGRGIVREHCPVFMNGEPVGETTSGTFLPYLSGAYAMALVSLSAAAVGTALEAEVRGRKIAAEVVALPFYKTGK